MPVKPLMNYPNYPEFEELLNSCGSMTRQLENLGHRLSVTLLAEHETNDYFQRYTTLNLNNTPVVVACSQTLNTNNFFHNLLRNANTTPIGKFLFANQFVKRQADMQIKQVTINHFSHHPIITANILRCKYQPNQIFWQRKSIFEYLDNEQFELIEVLLPELELFFNR